MSSCAQTSSKRVAARCGSLKMKVKMGWKQPGLVPSVASCPDALKEASSDAERSEAYIDAF